MKAILACLNQDPLLQSLQSEKHPYLLPVVGKAILDYQLESLYCLGIREVILLVSEQSVSLQRYIGDGVRWGMNVEVIQIEQDLNPGQLLDQVSESLQNQAVLLSIGLSCFVPTVPNQCLTASVISQLAANTWFIPAQQLNVFIKRYRGLPREQAPDPIYPILKQWPLNTLYDYWKCNLEILKDPDAQGFLPSFTQESGCMLGQQVHLPIQTETHKHNFIGDRSYLGPECELEQAIIGADCVIGANSQLSHTLVLDSSWIGEGLCLSHKIICGNRIYDPLTQDVLEFNEPIWLDNLNSKTNMRRNKTQFMIFLSRSLTKISTWMHNQNVTNHMNPGRVQTHSMGQQQLA